MSASPENPSVDVAMWIRYAREDALVAERIAADDELPPRAACWHAQQAAEKALKAALTADGRDFPRTHNLATLRALLEPGFAGKLSLVNLATLTAWSVEARYPGDWDEPLREDAEAAAEAANRVIATVTDALDDAEA